MIRYLMISLLISLVTPGFSMAGDGIHAYPGLAWQEPAKETPEPIRVHPTTARDHLNIEFVQARVSNATITIINLIGQELYRVEDKSREKNLKIPLHNLPPGVYLLRVVSGNLIKIQRVTIERKS